MIRFYFFYALASVIVGFFGAHRKLGFWGYFFGSLLLTPVIGALLVLAADKRRLADNRR